jgi:hypothetical protein
MSSAVKDCGMKGEASGRLQVRADGRHADDAGAPADARPDQEPVALGQKLQHLGALHPEPVGGEAGRRLQQLFQVPAVDDAPSELGQDRLLMHAHRERVGAQRHAQDILHPTGRSDHDAICAHSQPFL